MLLRVNHVLYRLGIIAQNILLAGRINRYLITGTNSSS